MEFAVELGSIEMEIDIYQYCPCYSGRKIKFCCGKDIVSDLNQIVSKVRSDQLQSALDQINRVLAKSGEKDCLLTLKTHVLFSLDQYEEAREINEKFLSTNPNHPIALQHASMALLAEGRVPEAIDRLQDAMDALKADEIPLIMSNAFRVLGGVLLGMGLIIAARAHLQFALLIRGNSEGSDLGQMIFDSFRVPSAPLVFKNDFRLEPTPPDKEWSGKYENVIRATKRGQFRLGLKILRRLDEIWPEQKEIVRSIAVMHMMLAENKEASAAWLKFSRLSSIPHWQAVEARAMSLMFGDPQDMVDVCLRTYELEDLDAFHGQAVSHPRLYQISSPDPDLINDDEPPPRYSFLVLDRDRIDSLDDCESTAIPQIRADLLVYGRQTDRSARVEMFCSDSESGEATAVLHELLGREPNETEVVAEISAVEEILGWKWQIPHGADPQRHRELVDEHRRKVMLDQWTRFPFECLGSKSVAEVSQSDDADLKLTVEGLICNVEQGFAQQMSGVELVAELREQLNIPQPEKLKSVEADDPLISPVRMLHIDAASLSDEQLKQWFGKSFSIANMAVLKKLMDEIVQRDQIAEEIGRDRCYALMARLTEDTEQAIEYFSLARKSARDSDTSVGVYLVQELEFRMLRGLTAKLPELLRTIEQQYISDPEVELELTRVMTKFGLLTPDGRRAALPSGDEHAEPAQSGIWTPDSSSQSPAAAAVGEPSKIWVPGSN